MLCVSRRLLRRASTDPFAVLELPRHATRDEVKKRYRELAKRFHPDQKTGDATKMEAVNDAYNLLIKENAYEELHVPAPSPAAQADPDEFARIVMDKERLGDLDPTTERVTPDGMFMYRKRDSDEWVAVERPITRPDQPRYASHGRFRRDTDLYGDIKKRRHDQEEREAKKSLFERFFVDRHSGTMPFDSPVLICIAFCIYVLCMYLCISRGLSKKDNLHKRWDYFAEVREHRVKVRDAYPVFERECDTVAAAAVVVFLAASAKVPEDQPIQPVYLSDLQADAPYTFYLLYNGL